NCSNILINEARHAYYDFNNNISDLVAKQRLALKISQKGLVTKYPSGSFRNRLISCSWKKGHVTANL
ncbi:MAG TPA: hypothetical protein VK553_06640, partial [Candidatus Nitrosopolaris rasttigaisensis]|nr:hypothetical protein [Candidatus Nitrosopolaris rasttigaisensis]